MPTAIPICSSASRQVRVPSCGCIATTGLPARGSAAAAGPAVVRFTDVTPRPLVSACPQAQSDSPRGSMSMLTVTSIYSWRFAIARTRSTSMSPASSGTTPRRWGWPMRGEASAPCGSTPTRTGISISTSQNMDGDQNALYRNDAGKFTDVAGAVRLAWGSRARERGGQWHRAAVRGGRGRRRAVRSLHGQLRTEWLVPESRWQPRCHRPGTNLSASRSAFPGSVAWSSRTRRERGASQRALRCVCVRRFDNDGRLDLYVNGTVTGGASCRYLFRNAGGRFDDVTPENIAAIQADHGAAWADVDADGDLDLRSRVPARTACTGSCGTSSPSPPQAIDHRPRARRPRPRDACGRRGARLCGSAERWWVRDSSIPDPATTRRTTSRCTSVCPACRASTSR